MFSFLKQSTASQTRILGPFVDDIDFKTLETGLTIANTDVKLSKNGAAAVNKNAGGGTHIVNGDYAFTFDATDSNTVGELRVTIAVAGALVVVAKFWVLEEAIYDALVGAAAAGFDANQRVDLGKWLGTAPLALVSQLIQAQANQLAAQAKADVNAEVDGALDTAVPVTPTADSINERVKRLEEDVTPARAGNLDNLDAGVSSRATPAQVGTELDNRNLNDLIQITGSVNDASPTATSFVVNGGLSATDDFYNGLILVFTGGALAGIARRISDYVGASKTLSLENALPQAPANTDPFSLVGIEALSGTGPTAAQVADAVWDEARVDHVGAGSFGEGVKAESLNAQAKADVNAETLDVLNTDTFTEPGQEAPPVSASLVKKIGYLYKFLRNRITSSTTEIKVYGDDALTVHQKSTHSDDGTTYDRGEFGTGP